MWKHKKAVLFIIILILFLPVLSHHVQAEGMGKISFIRGGDIWIYDGQSEEKLTTTGNVINPKWSFDGGWLAYLDAGNLTIYHLKTKRQIQIFNGEVSKFEWSPTENFLAFTSNEVLNLTNINHLDERKFENVALGVGNFSWAPNGTHFLVSTTANLLPTGWSSVKLFTIPIDAKMDMDKIEPFYTLPSQSNHFFAVGTSGFKWSNDGKWISFIGYPTASLSADSNTLCVLSSDGNKFFTLGEMLLNENWMKWAPIGDTLAFINGIGRFAVENKDITLENIPSQKNTILTPKGFVDWDFAWHQNQTITVSRAKETKWENESKRRPLPSLYKINPNKKVQTQLTHPPKGFGDYHPMQVDQNKLYWLRSNREKCELWQIEKSGGKPNKIISNIDVPSSYYEMYDWNSIISIFNDNGTRL